MWRLVAVWLSLAARSIAGVATSLPMAPTKPGLFMKPAVTRSSVKLQQGYGQQQGGYQQQGQQSQGQLPYGWEQLMDQNSGHVYYSNSQTGQTQWEPPQ